MRGDGGGAYSPLLLSELDVRRNGTVDDGRREEMRNGGGGGMSGGGLVSYLRRRSQASIVELQRA